MGIEYEAVIGLEVHTQLITKSKAFSSSATQFGDIPNSNTDPVTLGMPGTLPVLNTKVIDYAIKLGLATNCKIRKKFGFARKNYFYSDLPKGYQITQLEDPICYDGFVEIEHNNEIKKIGLTRIHIEEDTGKSIHDLDVDTLMDFNRAGVPLLEIVSEPDIRSAEEAYQYLIQLKQTVLYLGISTGNMEEGALRCDANISIRPVGQEKFGTRTEVKNMNSFRNVQKAIEFEIKRQTEVLESGGEIAQQTMMWDGSTSSTKIMRTKETSDDYRYFTEPDLPIMTLKEEKINALEKEIPELPLKRKYRLAKQYTIPSYDADVLVAERELADYYEEACGNLTNKSSKNNKLVSNWIMTDVLRIKAEKNIAMSEMDLPSFIITEIVDLLDEGVISSKIAKDIFPEAVKKKISPKKLVEDKGLKQVSDTELIEKLVGKVIEDNPESVEKYKNGRNNVFGFFVGQVMKGTQGKANPKMVSQMVKELLEN